MGYKITLPGGRAEAAVITPPIKYSYVHSDVLGTLALQCVYLGLDPVTKRPGNYFSHLIYGLSDSFSPFTAIRLWQSAFWKTENTPETPISLPELDESAVSEYLSSSERKNWETAALAQCNSDAVLQRVFVFLVRAWLTRWENGRIFIAAESDILAKAIWLLLRILPPEMGNDITFSTYESDALQASARIVGLWSANLPAYEAPAFCYQKPNQGFNAFSQKMAPVEHNAQGECSSAPFIYGNIDTYPVDKWTQFSDLYSQTVLQFNPSGLDSLQADRFARLYFQPEKISLNDLFCIESVAGFTAFVCADKTRFEKLTANIILQPVVNTFSEIQIENLLNPLFKKENESGDNSFSRSDAALELISQKIDSEDAGFIDRVLDFWFPRIRCMDLTTEQIWSLFTPPCKLPPKIFQSAFPYAFDEIVKSAESQAVSFMPSVDTHLNLQDWLFKGTKPFSEYQLRCVLDATFSNELKTNALYDFFLTDLQDTEFPASCIYGQYPQYLLPVLGRLETEEQLDAFIARLDTRQCGGNLFYQVQQETALKRNTITESAARKLIHKIILTCPIPLKQIIASMELHSFLDTETRRCLGQRIFSELKFDEVIADKSIAEFLKMILSKGEGA